MSTSVREKDVRDERRWNVVDRDGCVVFDGMLRRENAQLEADELNRSGLPEGRPYAVRQFGGEQ